MEPLPQVLVCTWVVGVRASSFVFVKDVLRRRHVSCASLFRAGYVSYSYFVDSIRTYLSSATVISLQRYRWSPR